MMEYILMLFDNVICWRCKYIEAFILKTLGVYYTIYFLKKAYVYSSCIERSMTGISKILSLYKIDQCPVWIEDKYEFISNFDAVFIAQMPEGNVCVMRDIQNKVALFNGQSKVVLEIDQFVSKWTGVALLVEKTEDSREPQYEKNLLKYWMEVLINIGCVFSFLILSINLYFKSVNENLEYIISFFVNCVGVATCLLLISKQLDLSNYMAQKVCTAFTKQDGCKNLLDTQAAKIGDTLSWSEIGLGFFLTNILWVFIHPSFFSYVLLINCLALPFSFWSIVYQKFVAKQWCVLCLLSQVVLWLFFVVNIGNFPFCFDFYRWDTIGIVVVLYVFVIFLVNIVVQSIFKQKKMNFLYSKTKRQYLNNDIFNHLISQQPYYAVDKGKSSIFFGNILAKNLVTIVINPFCSHCAELHKDIQEFDFLHCTDYCVQFIFNSYASNKQIVDQLLVSLYYDNNLEKSAAIYEEWFVNGFRDPGKFMQRNKIKKELIPDVEIECQKHWNWVDENNIVKTPLILINGYKLPANYTVLDLLFLDLC